MVEGTNEPSLLVRKLSKLKESNSSGPCACIQLLLVSIVRSLHYNTFTRAKEQANASQSFIIKFQNAFTESKILILYNWRKRFRIPSGRLFLAPDQKRKMINQTTTVLTAAMKLIRKLTPMMNLTFQIVIHLSDRKCRHLRPKHVDVHLEIKEIHAALLTKLKSSSIAETTLWNFPRLNSIWYLTLGMIHQAINCDRVSNVGRAEKMRQRTRMPFLLHSHRICLKTFLFMHRLHKTRFYSRVKHTRVSRLSLPTHGNKS